MKTGTWTGDGVPRAPAGVPPDTGRSSHRPRLDRVNRRHARWYPPRVLEPEVMGTEDEAAAYMDAAGLDHLARLDAGWAERVLAAGPRGPA
ncbi:MAG: hypothetical protein H0W36_12010, partial [Gemmatimonadetes bacterium]|nr:hypothetical protein [Gemmatimonadota bacterium]